MEKKISVKQENQDNESIKFSTQFDSHHKMTGPMITNISEKKEIINNGSIKNSNNEMTNPMNNQVKV